MSHARGPAKVPPEKNWPPVGWGSSFFQWEERVKRWRRQSAKERRSCDLPRQMADPTMLFVVRVEGFGDVKWSDGHGLWDLITTPTILRSGFWVKKMYSSSTPKFIGETWEEAMDAAKVYTDSVILKAQRETTRALHLFCDFDKKNKMRVLDRIVAEATSADEPS